MKSRTKSTIEIKGKRYDSTTGLSDLDEIFSASNQDHDQTDNQPADAATEIIKSARQRQPHNLASSASRHQRQPSHTLNRRSVKRPETRQKPAIKASKATISKLTYQPSSSLIKQSASAINQPRAEHAKRSLRSSSVRHFTNGGAAAASQPATRKTDSPKSNPQAIEKGRVFDIKPRANSHKSTPSTAIPIATQIVSATITSKFSQVLDKTEQANKHRYLEYTPVKKRTGLSRLSRGSRRALAFGVTGLAVLILAGYAVFLNKANIELQLADAKAGINATLPDYRPSGFSVGNFSYHTGLVAINYRSDDGHSYKLTQQASRLDSSALGQQLAAGGNSDYQTLQASGQTIFAKTGAASAKATWVSGGILYELDSNAALSPDQLTKIASSI